jgi:hypothetical protein
MISADTAYYPHFWNILTRLGEAEILLPVAALTGIALFAREKTRRLALSWMTLIVIAALVTIASKVAFIGWGLGWAAINFTGVSGHAMFAAAIYPILLVTFVSGDRQGSRLISLALGCGLAVLIGVSRIKVGAHSPSEVLAISETSVVSIKPVLLAILLVWAAVTPFELNASQTHSLVTRFALRMSGRATPFTRGDLIGSGRHQNSRPAFVAADMGAILTIPDAHVSNTAFQEPARP